MPINSEARGYSPCLTYLPLLPQHWPAATGLSKPAARRVKPRPTGSDKSWSIESRHIGPRDSQPIRRFGPAYAQTRAENPGGAGAAAASRIPGAPSEPAQRGAAPLVRRDAQFGDRDELRGDRVVRIVRELDRYHGFAAVPRPREQAQPLRLLPPAESRIEIEASIAETIQDGAASD